MQITPSLPVNQPIQIILHLSPLNCNIKIQEDFRNERNTRATSASRSITKIAFKMIPSAAPPESRPPQASRSNHTQADSAGLPIAPTHDYTGSAMSIQRSRNQALSGHWSVLCMQSVRIIAAIGITTSGPSRSRRHKPVSIFLIQIPSHSQHICSDSNPTNQPCINFTAEALFSMPNSGFWVARHQSSHPSAV